MESILLAEHGSEALAACLREAVARAKDCGRSIIASHTYAVSLGAGPIETFSSARASYAFRSLWGRPEQAFWLVGLGSAVQLASDGGQSIAFASKRHSEAVRGAIARGHGPRGTGPVFMGGFRYDPCAPQGQRGPVPGHLSPVVPWQGFLDALLVLPRLLFTWSPGGAWLTVNTLVSPGSDPEQEAETASALLHSLKRPPGLAPVQPDIVEQQQMPRGEWYSRVLKVARAIEEGSVSKVVLARSMVLTAGKPFSTETALHRASAAYPDCSVFAFGAGDATFVGATPEALVHMKNGVAQVSCLAGTAARGENPEEDRRIRQWLLGNPKERLEHSMVVASVAETLGEACEELHRDEEPRVMTLRSVQHLHTTFTCRPRAGFNLLDLVSGLHPTPAVGGAPKEKAMEMIRDLEGDRGWYAAPVGWLGVAGEGEFSVAIRSALLRDNRAVLFAGSGIVKGSDPEAEYQETEMKFLPLLSALGRG